MNKKNLATKETLLQCMKVAETSIEAADYFASQFEKQLKEAKALPEFKGILAKVQEYAEFVRHKLTSSTEPWLGQQNHLSDFQNMQNNLATAAVQQLDGEINGPVHMDIAFGESGKMLRGYSDANGPVSAKATAALDTLLNSWFSKQNNVSKGSQIFVADKDGEVMLNGNGVEVSADSERLKSVISDPEVGCEAFMSEKGIEVSIQLHQYPAEQVEADRVMATEQTAPVITTSTIQREEKPEVEPEAPHTGMGASTGG